MTRPLTDDDIVAARVRAAEGGVPWNRADAISEALRKAEIKRLARLRRRNQIIAAAVTATLLLAALVWFLTRRG